MKIEDQPQTSKKYMALIALLSLLIGGAIFWDVMRFTAEEKNSGIKTETEKAELEKCSITHATEQAQKLIDKAPTIKPLQENINFLKKKIIENGIPPEKADAYLLNVFIYKNLNQNNCPIPKKIEQKFIKASYGNIKLNKNNCSLTDFKATALLEFNKVQSLPNYSEIEPELLRHFLLQVEHPAAQRYIQENWTNEQFRHDLIIAILQTARMAKEGCKNTFTVMQDLLAKISRDIEPEPINQPAK
ncbi:MAG: hypothetical protein R3E13_05220 [Alphaproteobacteria bacterium]